MRFVQKTPTQLTVYSSPALIWLGSGFVALCGISIFSIPFFLPDEYLGAQVICVVFLVWSLVMLRSDGQAITWTFDKTDNSLLVESRLLFIAQTSTHKLTDICQVQVVSQLTGEGGRIFGIELVLKEGERLQLCPGFTLSEFTAKEGVLRIPRFLELPS